MKKHLIVMSLCVLCASWAMILPAEARGAGSTTVQRQDREVIVQAQRQLKALGFNPGTIDGNVGSQTVAALREYQRAYRLPQTGGLDDATLRSLLPDRFQTSTGPTGLSNREVIIQAQRQLKALGFDPGTTDGDVGPQTEAAVQEYQRAYRLPPTGMLDEVTVRSLLPEQSRTSPAPLSNREVTLQAQRQLKALGFNPGTIDGNIGPQTTAALREYQRAYRLPTTGTLDEVTVRSLLPDRAQSSAR
jgi:peptidoglycan hydrolase-like protein with peptidoglycan-binding domain